MSKQPNDWVDINDWQDIGTSTQPSGPSPAMTSFQAADYVKGATGYIVNPRNPNAKKTGKIKALDTSTGKSYEIELAPSVIPALVPGLIEGNIRNRPENQQSVLDRIKRAPVMLPFGGGESGLDVGNVAEGIQSALPTPRNALRTGGAMVGGMIGAGAGGAAASPTIAGIPVGAIGGATVGGAAGASVGESIYQAGDRLLNGGHDSPKTAGDALKLQGGAVVQGAIQEGGGALAAKGVTKLSKMLAERQVAKILAPSGNAMKADIAATAEALASDFPIGFTDKGTLAKINTRVNTLGQGVDQAYAALNGSGATVPSAPIVKALTDAKQAFLVKGKPIPGLENIVADYENLIDGIGANKSLTTDEFRKVKQGWDTAINWSRNAQARTPAMEQALTDGANAIRESLHNLSPSLAKADASYSLWKTAQDSMQNKVTNAVGSRNALVSNSTILSGVIGSGIGAAVGGAAGAAGGAATAETLNMLMGTTVYRTMSLYAKKQVQDALAKGLTQKAIGLILAQGSMSAEEGVRKLMVPDNVPKGKR